MTNQEEATFTLIITSLSRSLVLTGLIMYSKASSNYNTA